MPAVLFAVLAFACFGNSLIHPYLPVLDLQTHRAVGGDVDVDETLAFLAGNLTLGGVPGPSGLSRRQDSSDYDDTHYLGFTFYKADCGIIPQYAAVNRDKGQASGCLNLVIDKPWASIETTIGSGYSVYLFAGPDCCTSGVQTPCAVYKGIERKRCITSAGPEAHTGFGFAKSLLWVDDGYIHDEGSASQATCAKPNGAVNCPKCSSDTSSQKRGVPVASKRADDGPCQGSVNCETSFVTGRDRPLTRFKDGMGPGSDWYRENVTPYSNVNDLSKRQQTAGCDSDSKDGVTWRADRSKSETFYGNRDPQEVVGAAKQHCYSSTCDEFSPLKLPTYYTKRQPGKDPVYAKGRLVVTFHGFFNGVAEKENYVNATRAISRYNTREHASVTYPEFTQYNFWAMKFVSLYRYVPYKDGIAWSGSLQMHVEFQELGPGACNASIARIDAGVGEVNSIAYGFFGELGDDGKTCNDHTTDPDDCVNPNCLA